MYQRGVSRGGVSRGGIKGEIKGLGLYPLTGDTSLDNPLIPRNFPTLMISAEEQEQEKAILIVLMIG